MATTYRLTVHCDENATGACLGLVEYASPDRIKLARQTDLHLHTSGWLRGYKSGATYDVCPACRLAVEARLAEPMKELKP